MKITFIRPNMFEAKSSAALQPLVFSILKSLCPEDIETELIDERVEEIPRELQTDLIAMTVETFSAKRAFRIADHFRGKGIPVVMGGYHPTLEPDECLQHADAVVIGDAEPNWSTLLKDFRKGEMKQKYDTTLPDKSFSTNHDRSIYKGKKYLPIHLVQWGRGCPHDCDFCSIKSFYPKSQFMRPIDEVIKEISGFKDDNFLFLVDDNLYHNRKKFEAFLQKIKPLKKKWACQISLQVARNEKLVKLMHESGCVMALVGIESFDEENLKLMNKSWNNAKQDYQSAIDVFRKNGIMIYGTFIFGYDHDTVAAFDKAIKFAVDNKFFIANFNPLYPMPGTKLYNRMNLNGRMPVKKWWADPDFYYGKSMFTPVNFTPEELEKYCYRAKLSFNSLSSIFYRLMDGKANAKGLKRISLFLLANLTNRREIKRKQGLILAGKR
ncbi:MAG: radical SAM protein [Bacteroidetes bacterium]|nr:MAG: radical SAM protein [Bacteroidota bacterium]